MTVMTRRRAMTVMVAASLVLPAAVAGAAGTAKTFSLHDAPLPMSEITFAYEDGRPGSLADFRGKHVLLNIWATWCPPCREEMPTLDALQEKLGGDDFHVLPLSIDRAGMEIVRRFYDEIGIRHLDTYLAEDIRVMAAFAVVGLPTTILIDRDGFERGRLVGPGEWDSPAVMAQIQTIINERSE